MHIFQPELHIDQWPEVRAAVIERNIVELEGPTARVGVVDCRDGAVEQRIAAAVDVKIARGQANRLIVVIGALETPGAQKIVRVAGEAEGLAGAQILVLGDEARLHREAVARAEELILRVDADICQVVGSHAGHPIGYYVGRQPEGAELPGVPSPRRFDGDPPRGRDSLKGTGPLWLCAGSGEGPG